MQILKIIGIVLLGMIALVLIIAAFSKKDYTIEREIVINKPKQVVFDYVKYSKNQLHFNKWMMTDPNAHIDYRGIDGTVGFVIAWDSKIKQVGKGEQEIAQIVENEKIDYNLHFIKPFDGLAKSTLTTEDVSETQTKVKWAFSSSMAYPMNFIMLFMDFESILGKDLEASLGNLKAILEND